MSKSLLETGLPPWLFTPRMAVASGIAFGFVVLLIGSLVSFIGGLFDRTDLNSAPECFTIAQPLKVGTGRLDTNEFDARRIVGQRQQNVAKVRAAAAECTADACPRAAQASYRSAVRTYLMHRSEAASQFQHRYGEAGLQHARWVYGEEEDKSLIIGLRQRYAAGLFDLKWMDNGGHDYIGATRMLLFGKAQDFKPCSAG